MALLYSKMSLKSMSNMADAAAARREARRRRILENSQNRLQLISGKNEEDSPRESPIRTVLDRDHETPISSESSIYHTSCMSNGVLIGEVETLEALLLSRDVVAAGDREVANDLATFTARSPVEPLAFATPETSFEPPPDAPFSSPTPEPAQMSIWEKMTSHKYDIVLLSLLIQLLYGMSFITFDSMYFFIPVIIYIVTKMIWFPMENNSFFGNILLLINGMTPSKIHKILYITQFASVISRDVCVFLFTTICVQSLWLTLRDGLIT